MNTQTDLRHTLAEHAADLDSLATVERLGQVHGRIRAVRRRRRAGVAGVAAAVVAIAGGALLFPHADRVDPAADRQDLAGHTAPATMESLGYTYRFVRAVEGGDAVRLRLGSSDTPQLVSWAAETGPVTLRSPFDLDGDGAGPDRSDEPAVDFSDFHLFYPGQQGVVSASGTGPLALAVYELVSPAPGVTEQGVTYRERSNGRDLVDAQFAAPGRGSLEFTVMSPAGGIDVSRYCSGAPSGYQVNVEVLGQLQSWGACDDANGWDGGGGSVGTDVDTADAGATLTARVWLTRGAGRTLGNWADAVDLPGVTLGLGVYTRPEAARTVAGYDLPTEVEYDGHVWAYADSSASGAGAFSFSSEVAAGPDPLLTYVVVADTARTARLFLDGHQVGPWLGGGSATTGPWLRNRTAMMEVRVDRPSPTTRVVLATYRRIS